MKTCPHCGASLEPDAPTLELTLSDAPDQTPFTIPIAGGGSYPVPRKLLETWQIAYPGVDLEAEFNKMVAWAASNPTKAKTRKGACKFANNWLMRAQDDVARNGNGRSRNYGFEAEREQITRVIGRQS